MSKQGEIEYVAKMASVLSLPLAEVEGWLTRKPYPDVNRHLYFIDVGQIMKLLPPVPARVLDLGVGPGWTSEFLARSGYSVVGLDIAEDMIALARRRLDPALDLRFDVHDYEHSIDAGLGQFDAAVIYDALHHAVDEGQVAASVFKCLKPGGVFITIEPGVGHSATEAAKETISKYGTTEKDMEYARQHEVMRRAGFGTIRQYLRVSQLPLESVHDDAGRAQQRAHIEALWHGTLNQGLTSVVVAVKDGGDHAPLLAPIPAPAAAAPVRPPAGWRRALARLKGIFGSPR